MAAHNLEDRNLLQLSLMISPLWSWQKKKWITLWLGQNSYWTWPIFSSLIELFYQMVGNESLSSSLAPHLIGNMNTPIAPLLPPNHWIVFKMVIFDCYVTLPERYQFYQTNSSFPVTRSAIFCRISWTNRPWNGLLKMCWRSVWKSIMAVTNGILTYDGSVCMPY